MAASFPGGFQDIYMVVSVEKQESGVLILTGPTDGCGLRVLSLVRLSWASGPQWACQTCPFGPWVREVGLTALPQAQPQCPDNPQGLGQRNTSSGPPNEPPGVGEQVMGVSSSHNPDRQGSQIDQSWRSDCISTPSSRG